jgi:hypothetical protein
MTDSFLVVDIFCKLYNSLGNSAGRISDLAGFARSATECARTGTARPRTVTASVIRLVHSTNKCYFSLQLFELAISQQRYYHDKCGSNLI